MLPYLSSFLHSMTLAIVTLRKQRLPRPLFRRLMLLGVIATARKLHRAVVDAAEAQTPHVTQVILVHPPGVARTLARHYVEGALCIAGGEPYQHWLFCDPLLPEARGTLGVAVLIHVVQDPAHTLRDELALQRPGGVDVAKDKGKIRNITVHHASIDEHLREIHGTIIDDELHAAHELHGQTGGCHDDVRGQFITRT